MPAPKSLRLLMYHIPDTHEHLVRYYGYYSNRSRGASRLAEQERDTTAGEIEGAAFLGQDVVAHVAVKGLERPIIARLAAGHALAAKLARGHRVRRSWQADQAVLLKD